MDNNNFEIKSKKQAVQKASDVKQQYIMEVGSDYDILEAIEEELGRDTSAIESDPFYY